MSQRCGGTAGIDTDFYASKILSSDPILALQALGRQSQCDGGAYQKEN